MKKITTILLLLMLTVQSAFSQARQPGKPFIRTFTSEQYHGHNRTFDVECDATGRVIVANFEGLLIYDGVLWQMIHTPGISRVTCLYKADDGTIWFGGYNVLGKVEEGDTLSVTFVNDDRSTEFGEVTEIFEYRNTLHFNTNEEKAYHLKNGKIVRDRISSMFTKRMGKEKNVLTEVLSAKNYGYRFYATDNSGVRGTTSDGKQLFHLTTDDGLCSNKVSGIAYDGLGNLWGVTDNGIFAVAVNKIYTHYDSHQELTGQVTSILTVDDRLYVGTLEGLFILQEDQTFKPVADDMQACWQLAPMPGGRVLAATADGVILFNPDSTNIRLTDKHTLSVAALDENTFVAGEIDGIKEYSLTEAGNSSQAAAARKPRWSATLLKGISVGEIPNVCRFEADGKGGLWAISLYNKTYHMASASKEFVEKENKNMTLLLSYTDSQQRHWHCADNGTGLMCDGQDETFTRWLLPFSEMTISCLHVADGIAWVGGQFGLIRLDLNEAAASAPLQSHAHIRYLNVEGQNIHFHVSSGKYDPVGKTLYSYRLHDGDEWSNWSEEKDYELRNQMYGFYRLTVRSKDAYGQVAVSKTIQFRLLAPFYLRWYSLLAYLFIFLFIIYLGVLWRERRMKKEQERLEAIVEERTSELRSAQHQLLRQEREATVGKLTKGLIDRILNPMNYINNFSHLTLGLVKDLKQNINDLTDELDDCKDEGALTDKSADEINDLIDDSTDVLSMMQTNIDKIEQHGLSTTRTLKAMEAMLKEQSGTAQPTDLCALLAQNREMLQNYYKDDIAKLNIQISWQMPAEPVTLPIVADSFSKTVMSILSNSIYALQKKHDKETYKDYVPEMRITLQTASDGTTLTLRDNGIGIEESILDKVFDPFFTTKPTSEAPGVGLYLAQQTIQNLGGTLTVASVKDEYTEFTIWIPSKN